MSQKRKAIVLLSGGLDSGLAAKIVQKEGVDLVAVTFRSYFFDNYLAARKQAQELGIPIRREDIAVEQFQLVKNPLHGYGKNMNPCIDCHALMIRKAGEMMTRERADFLVTGEVLGQRPFSQNKEAMEIIDQEAGVVGLVLRPLSAKLLPLTKPEREGWVKRKNLFSIRGKSRKEQLALSKKLGLKKYLSPAGGCLLTDPNFSQRLRNLLRRVKNPSASDFFLLKLGRHFWQKDILLVVGRNREENERLASLKEEGDVLVELKGTPGPTVLIRSWRGKIPLSLVSLAKKKILAFAHKAGKNESFLVLGQLDKREK